MFKKNELRESKLTLGSKMNYLLFSTFVACLITNPFDVAVAKIGT